MKEATPSPNSPAQPDARSPAESRHRRRRGRTRSFSSTAASSSSLSTTPLSSPSPFHRLLSPFHSASSAVPFSWEQQPGVPKTPNSDSRALIPWSADLLLPRPPPIRSASAVSHSRNKKRCAAGGVAADPFAVALVECAKDLPAGDEMEKLWAGERVAGAGRGRGRAAAAAIAIAGRFAMLDLYGSCKAACSVAEATIAVPRSGHRSASYGLLNRRSG